MTLYSRQVGLKMAQKRSKSTQNTQNQLSIFPDAPLDAHFHRLKRRFWPFFKRSKRFIGEKRGTRLHNIFLRFLGDVAPFFLKNTVWEHQCWNRKEKEKEKGSQIWKEKVSKWCVNLIKTSFTSGKKVSPYFFYFFIIIKKMYFSSLEACHRAAQPPVKYLPTGLKWCRKIKNRKTKSVKIKKRVSETCRNRV